jgi:hypothetical protein
MKFSQKLTLVVMYAILSSAATIAQSPKIPETRNAALRYWIAFADLQDLPADAPTQDLLEKTAAGETPWDETKLGPIVEKNEDAILGMQRATALPDCDWGIEYSRGPRASVAHMMNARVLARLNTLYGFCQAANGDSQAAMSTWVAGVKFSQDLAKGGTLIFALAARSALLSNLNAIRITAGSPLSPYARSLATFTLQQLPQTAFDWSDSWELETYAIELGWDSILKSRDPRRAYQGVTGEELKGKFRPPSSDDFTLFRKFMDEVARALKFPPDEASKKLAALRDGEKSLNPLLQNSIPNFEKVNANRAEVQYARDAALRALTAHPQK